MASNESLFNMTMLLAKYNNDAADYFASNFQHSERQRCSTKAEIREINDWWANEIQPFSRMDERSIRNMDHYDITDWLDEFEARFINIIMSYWLPSKL